MDIQPSSGMNKLPSAEQDHCKDHPGLWDSMALGLIGKLSYGPGGQVKYLKDIGLGGMLDIWRMEIHWNSKPANQIGSTERQTKDWDMNVSESTMAGL